MSLDGFGVSWLQLMSTAGLWVEVASPLFVSLGENRLLRDGCKSIYLSVFIKFKIKIKIYIN
jgi:hypothetical protein